MNHAGTVIPWVTAFAVLTKDKEHHLKKSKRLNYIRPITKKVTRKQRRRDRAFARSTLTS